MLSIIGFVVLFVVALCIDFIVFMIGLIAFISLLILSALAFIGYLPMFILLKGF